MLILMFELRVARREANENLRKADENLRELEEAARVAEFVADVDSLADTDVDRDVRSF